MQISPCKYWTDEFLERAARPMSWEEIGNLSLDVLKTMPQPIAQLCGPLSTGGLGSRDANVKLFTRCIGELRAQGLNPFDQSLIEMAIRGPLAEWRAAHPEGEYCTPILESVYRPIFESGLVTKTFFLPGWQTSFGSKWERGLLTRLGIAIEEFPQEWYTRILEEIRSSETVNT